MIKANQLYCDDYSSSDKKSWDEKRENYINLIKSKQKGTKKQEDTEERSEAAAAEEEETTKPSKIYPPSSAAEYKLLKPNYKDVVLQFEKAGFTNIEIEEVADITTGFLADEGDVASVTIDGNSLFFEEDAYSADALVRITYHVKKES